MDQILARWRATIDLCGPFLLDWRHSKQRLVFHPTSRTKLGHFQKVADLRPARRIAEAGQPTFPVKKLHFAIAIACHVIAHHKLKAFLYRDEHIRPEPDFVLGMT
jgi:hypothetical protein